MLLLFPKFLKFAPTTLLSCELLSNHSLFSFFATCNYSGLSKGHYVLVTWGYDTDRPRDVADDPWTHYHRSSPLARTPQLGFQKKGRTGNHTRMQSEAWGSHSHSNSPSYSHRNALRKKKREEIYLTFSDGFLITGWNPSQRTYTWTIIERFSIYCRKPTPK